MAQEQIQLESRKNEELATVLGSYKTKFISDANKPTKFGERNTDMLPGANNTNFQFNRPALPKSLWIDGAQDDELVIINNLDDDEEDSLIKNVEIRKQESPTSELKKSFHNFSINVDDYPVRMTPPKPKVINIKPDISNIKPDISNMSYFERIKLENEFDEKKPISVEDIKREHSVSRSVHASSDGAQLNTKLPKTSSPTLYKYFSVLKKSPSSSQILNSTEVLARDSDEEVVEISDSEEEIEDVISPEKSNNIVIEDSFDSIRDKIVLDLPNVQPIVPQSSERSVIESSFAGIEDEDCLELPIVYPISPRGSVKSVSDSFTGLEDEDTFELPNVKPSNSILNSTAFNSKKRASPVFELDASLEGSKLQLDESASFEIKAPYKRQKNNVIESDSE